VIDGPNIFLKLHIDHVNIFARYRDFYPCDVSVARYLLRQCDWLSHAGIDLETELGSVKVIENVTIR